MQKAKENSSTEPTSARTNVLERSASFNLDNSVQRSRSQSSETHLGRSSAAGVSKTTERIDSKSHDQQNLSDSSSATGYETPDMKCSNIQQQHTGDFKSPESESSTIQHYYEAEADSSQKSSKSNSAIHSQGSSFDYDHSYTHSGTSSNVSINLLLFYLLLYLSIYYFMSFLETVTTVETSQASGTSLTLLWDW